MVSWHIVTSAAYKAGSKVDGDMYFLSDTHEIYRGSESFSEAVVMYTDLPVEGIAKNKLYINSATLEGRIYDGAAWTTVIKPVDSTVATDGENPVNSKAVIAYVAAELAKFTSSDNVISKLTWDSANHLLEVTKGSNDTENIVFNGLGVSLTYEASTGKLQLLDASGNAIGNPITLDLERFVSSGVYNPDTKSIVLYFDAEKTDSVTIPVGDLVDIYTAEATDNSLNLTVESNVVKGSVKISKETGNTIELKDDGIYVAAVDLSGKMDKVTDGVSGNILTIGNDGQAVDSGKTFDDLTYNNTIYTGTTLEEATTGHTPIKGDVAIISNTIGTSDKIERKAYIHDGTTWLPMTENYNAANVYFPSDLTTTTAIGNITLTNGQATIASAGKNLLDTWNTIFVKEQQPSVTQPSVSISFSQAGSYEVGTSVTPSYTATLNAGKYEFNSNNGATGVTASSWEITDTAGHTASTNTGSFDAFVVEDATNYKITAKANYDDSPINPVTNVGNPADSSKKITAGSNSATSGAVTGYRKTFYGILTEANDAPTSDVIRGLTGSTSALKKGSTFSIKVTSAAKRVVIAYPATLGDLASVKYVEGSNADVTSSFTTRIQVDVEGAGNYTAIPYKVYIAPAAYSSTVTYNVTL